MKASPSTPLVDRANRSANVSRLLMVGLAMLTIVGGLLFLPEDLLQPMTLGLLAFLAVLGVFFVLTLAIGVVKLTAKTNSETFARAFLDGLEHGTIVTDWDGRVVYANGAYGELTGARDPRKVESVERIFARSDEASEIVYRMNQTVRAGHAVSQEFRLVQDIRALNDGARNRSDWMQPHWYRVSARQMKLSNRRRALIVWEIADVTHERRRQESVFMDLQHAIDYLDHAPAGFFSSQSDGSIVYLNATLADWLGIDLAQFEPGSMNVSEIVLNDGMALLNAPQGEAGETRTHVVDLELARSNGQSLSARLYHKVPVARDGAPGATRTLVLDRQAGTASEAEMLDAEVRFSRFFNNTPIAIASFDGDGTLLRSNAPFQRLFQSVLAKSDDNPNIEELAGPDDAIALRTAMAAANGGQAQIDFIDCVLPGTISQIADEECSVRFFVSAVSDGGRGKKAKDEPRERAILCAIELTEQKALERQMAQGQKMQAIGELAGGIAHDFNNVLTAIIGFSDLLLANHRPSDPSFQDIMNIKQNANRAATLVRQLLAFSRRQTLRPQTLSVPDVLSDLQMLIARLVGDKVELQLHHGRDLWPLKADIGQFEQVIVNLCVNARDAILDARADGGTITITTSNIIADDVARDFSRKDVVPADYVMVEVADDGTGMPADVMAKIFDPFFSTKEVGKGTGLGLSTVYGIVKQSGGFIDVKSEQGEGTTFRILMPRHEPSDAELHEAAAEAEDKREQRRDLAGSATIVFAEDEDAIRAVGVRTLASRGYTVHEAENGEEALELMEELGDEVDLVVSDVVMPEMDGPQLLNGVREMGLKTPFIFASGYAAEAFEKNLPEAERTQFGFIAKPYALKDLATAVKEALEDQGED
jgi:two-component system cell cycle sensor histidine kinase/response regulator CckA